MKNNTVIRSLFILMLFSFRSYGQEAVIPYGNNPDVGKYLQTEDAKIYYEVYGVGEPLLLLHGGYYGYIDEYSQYLPELSKHFKVIAVGTRGHGKSEIGTATYSYHLFAQDALKVLTQEGHEKAMVMGFSDGSITGLILAARYTDRVDRLVSMGGALGVHAYRKEALQQIWEMEGANELKNLHPFMKERQQLMPEPERFAEWVDKLKRAWLEPVWVTKEQAANIKCPVLIVGADRDQYIPAGSLVETQEAIPNAQLLILPNSGHVSLILNPEMLKLFVIPFLSEE